MVGTDFPTNDNIERPQIWVILKLVNENIVETELSIKASWRLELNIM